MCFRTIHKYQCCGRTEDYIHYPCPEVINKEICQYSEGPDLNRTTPCSTCLPRVEPEPRIETTLHSSETGGMIILGQLRDDRRERVSALQVLAEVVFAMERGGGSSDQTLGSWAGIFERIERLREAVFEEEQRDA